MAFGLGLLQSGRAEEFVRVELSKCDRLTVIREEN